MKKRSDASVGRPGLTRRGLLTSMGAGLGAAALGLDRAAAADGPALANEPGELSRVALEINGRTHRLLVEARWSLLFVLREKLGLTGAKEGCGRGECGACTVLIGDAPRYACLTLAVEAEGRPITTVEGLMDGEELGATQRAFLEEDGFQCGYCTSGQILAAEGLLRSDPGTPSAEAIRRAMSGNLCRCGAYPHIERAVAAAARDRGSRS